MSSRFKDFDQYFAEMQREPLRLRIFGEEHELPPAIPASVVLSFHRLQQRDRAEDVGDTELLELFGAVFGQERVERWFGRGLDVEQMVELLSWAMEQYGAGQPAPKAPRPGKVARGKRNA
jgi:hypothetical protein